MNVKSNSDTIFTFRIFFHYKLNWFLHITLRAKNYCKKFALKANLTSQKTSTISTGIKKYAIVGWLNRAGRSGSVAVQNEHIPLAKRLAKSSGYFDTSSRPAGTLKFKQKFMFQNCSIFTFSDSISHCL